MSQSESQAQVAAVPTIAQVSLIGLFVTALVTAQLTASKVLAFSLPFSLPITGAELVLPGAALAYALTFLASDCYAELYGRRAAQVVVNVAFAMNFVVLVLVWSTIAAPAAETSIDPGMFADVLGASTNIVLGSLLAYVVSQNWDVIVFHRIREYTGGERLWLRNIGSTASSQAIDTVIFVGIAFSIAPALLGVGPVLGVGELLALMIGQYLLKLAIAVLDTPIVYAVVSFVRSREATGAEETTAA
ncbi:queuosine precursor transporter [Natronorubrum sp. JWXQ-INN-674]|uniref:Probable queuosine precursor transporter n=1 Tax=Natronorubrum halalkaliphilum TaxID=2691917 RepID=A0A6B0VSB7_9EURY|nr:queuosine precursor transporter [Natronorubrum halalkaliphilum]MXV63409.1 queuosine precursor transporter [Natronorubrum halalkaliphilum]